MSNSNPVLNNPYEEPSLHYATNEAGELDYADIQKGRRIFTPDINVIPLKQGAQKELFTINDFEEEYSSLIINLLRKEIGKWRTENYPGTTRVTKELLNYWFNNPERHAVKKLFFAQREAIETAIWLNEIADKSNSGQHILNEIKQAQSDVSAEIYQQLPRIAFKMATGTGKTVVMGAFIVYHFFNRQEYRSDTRFADYFLIIAPGITIRDRLNVLKVDKKTKSRSHRSDYYAIRDLVPYTLDHMVEQINSRLVITNYHQLEPHTLQGNKRSPMDGKIIGHDAKGKEIKQEAREDFNQVIKRIMKNFKQGSRLLVLNDEAHHCYLPKSKEKTTDTEVDENARAAVWFTGLSEIAKKYKLTAVYDLSATPYYLQGSGYQPYTLFGWTVTDFGLIEAIESGLVKIPYLPESDNTQELEMPILRNLYEHVKDDLPKKGQRKKKQDAKELGHKFTEEPPQLPKTVKGALDQFYNHYVEYSKSIRKKGEEAVNLLSKPPVFIIVCNNTSVSKEVYKFIAGYEYSDDAGEKYVMQGHYDLFNNYDQYDKPKKQAPTLLIDSGALEDGDQINDEFKAIFSSEIDEFKREYASIHGHGSAENITDAELLREVVNTVGQPGKLGGHIRCVVSVSMLTEGWDANTVTHIMGLRAFGSQLLCEQVAGRALRRMNYYLQSYDKKTGEPVDPKDVYRYKDENLIWKFPPEYAHIIGVPFKFFKGGKTGPVTPPTYTRIHAIPDRQDAYEITFPNVTGYRLEYQEDEIKYDFSKLENYEIDCSKFPLETTSGTAFSPDVEKMVVKSVFEKRDQEMHYIITQSLIKHHFSDDDNNPQIQKFNRLKEIVKIWYDTKIKPLNITDPEYKKLLYFDEPKKIADHIARGINTHINTSEYIKPVFNYYNRFGSTKYVNGLTSKEVFDGKKSHVNYVTMDSGWEGICAKTLDELDNVVCYVKNQFLGFAIPYTKDAKDRLYFTDFIVRVKKKDGTMANLMIEISGMNMDKAEKKWFVENRWLPAVNSLCEKFSYDRWEFIEIANDIRDIKNQLSIKIGSL